MLELLLSPLLLCVYVLLFFEEKDQIASIQKELEAKETKAMGEREKWLEKRKGYRGEAAKWEKESQVAEQARVKFDKLKD